VEKAPLYRQVAEEIRQQILDGKLRPGDSLPPVRVLAARLGCTPGTVQQAYRALAEEGIVTSRPGQGTRIGVALPEDRAPYRRASLVHQAEAFLLEALGAGYSPGETERAFAAALDRWRALAIAGPEITQRDLRFAGSHDPAVSLLASRFPVLCPGCGLSVAFTGSLGGLIALAEGKADLAGSHLWDEESDSYNAPFVRRLLPGRRLALVTLAHRRLGLIVPRGNPQRLAALGDLARPGVRVINRQRGAGTRVWLDAHLNRLGVPHREIAGYETVVATHAEVARAIAEGGATAGLGAETAALEYGLGFVRLTTEPYDLVLPEETLAGEAGAAIMQWLRSEPGRQGEGAQAITALGGYDTGRTGELRWVE